MWEPVTIPFKNNNIPQLPAPDDIRNCLNVLKETSTSKVIAVNEKIIAKFGTGIDFWEGQALIYLEREVSKVPAPRLYAMYHDSEQVFLVMERIPGVQLDSIWCSLTDTEKQSIITRLRVIFEAMRAAECPQPKFFGGLDGGSVHHYLFYDLNGSGNHLGPFKDGAAFVQGLLGNFRALVKTNSRPDYKVRFYEKQFANTVREYRPTLTHGDAQRQNIIVTERPNSSDNKKERSFDVVLVDWEKAGWYPDFWEAFCTSSLFDLVYWEEDWCELSGQFVQLSAPELLLMLNLDKDMR
jgi:hypothetical protein